MRKVILTAFFAAATTALFAQKIKLRDVQKSVEENKYEQARTQIDQYLTTPKAQEEANAWYWKGVVYNELSRDSTKKDMDYRGVAFEAFKKYQQMDPKNIMLTLQQNGSLFQIYEGYYNQGIQSFNAKDYVQAFDDFRNALNVKDYIHDRKYEINGFSFPALDTQLVNLAGSAGFLAKKEDSAIKYFAMLADAKLSGEDFKDIYPILVDYYARKGDEANKAKYLAVGQELYPENPYWIQVQLDVAGDDKAKRLDILKDLVAQNPNNSELATEYAVELFNFTYAQDRPADYAQKQEELTAALKKAIAVRPDAPYANFIMTQHLSNQIYDLQQSFNAVKGNKPEDVKKRQEIDKTIDAKFEELFTYASTAYQQYEQMNELKPVDKANFRNVINQLIDYHTMKKQTDKVKFYDEKLKTL